MPRLRDVRLSRRPDVLRLHLALRFLRVPAPASGRGVPGADAVGAPRAAATERNALVIPKSRLALDWLLREHPRAHVEIERFRPEPAGWVYSRGGVVYYVLLILIPDDPDDDDGYEWERYAISRAGAIYWMPDEAHVERDEIWRPARRRRTA